MQKPPLLTAIYESLPVPFAAYHDFRPGEPPPIGAAPLLVVTAPPPKPPAWVLVIQF